RLVKPGEQILHVAAELRDAEQARLLVEKVLDLSDRHALLGEQVEDDPGVEVATACAHGQSGERREAHRCLHAPPTLERTHGGAIAEMRDDDALAADVGAVKAERIDDVFVGKAVETIATDALVIEFPRQSR